MGPSPLLLGPAQLGPDYILMYVESLDRLISRSGKIAHVLCPVSFPFPYSFLYHLPLVPVKKNQTYKDTHSRTCI